GRTSRPGMEREKLALWRRQAAERGSAFSCRKYFAAGTRERKLYSRWLSTQTTVMAAASERNENELVSSNGVSISCASSRAQTPDEASGFCRANAINTDQAISPAS